MQSRRFCMVYSHTYETGGRNSGCKATILYFYTFAKQ